MGEGEGEGEGMRVRARARVSLFSCIPHPFVCLQVGVCYLSRAFSGVVGVGEWLSDVFNVLLLLLLPLPPQPSCRLYCGTAVTIPLECFL
jgi:hypothetical protein